MHSPLSHGPYETRCNAWRNTRHFRRKNVFLRLPQSSAYTIVRRFSVRVFRSLPPLPPLQTRGSRQFIRSTPTNLLGRASGVKENNKRRQLYRLHVLGPFERDDASGFHRAGNRKSGTRLFDADERICTGRRRGDYSGKKTGLTLVKTPTTCIPVTVPPPFSEREPGKTSVTIRRRTSFVRPKYRVTTTNRYENSCHETRLFLRRSVCLFNIILKKIYIYKNNKLINVTQIVLITFKSAVSQRNVT